MSSQESISKLWLVMPVLLFIVFVFILIIPGNAILINSNNYYFGTTGNFAYGQQQPNQMNPNNIANSLEIQSISSKKVHVGDIDITYKTFGKVMLFYSLAVVVMLWMFSSFYYYHNNDGLERYE